MLAGISMVEVLELETMCHRDTMKALALHRLQKQSKIINWLKEKFNVKGKKNKED